MLKAIKPKQNCGERIRMYDGSGSKIALKVTFTAWRSPTGRPVAEAQEQKQKASWLF